MGSGFNDSRREEKTKRNRVQQDAIRDSMTLEKKRKQQVVMRTFYVIVFTS
jgi:hypothetical protein